MLLRLAIFFTFTSGMLSQQQKPQRQQQVPSVDLNAIHREALADVQIPPAPPIAAAIQGAQQPVVPPAPGLQTGLLADSFPCRNEILQYCPHFARSDNQQRTDDVLVLLCLQDAGDNALSPQCQQELWGIKLNLTEDGRFRQEAMHYCQLELQTYPCAKNPPGIPEPSHLVLCLVEYKNNMTNQACKNFLTRIEAIMFTDFSLVGRFTMRCKADIERLNCGQGHFAPAVRDQIKKKARVIHSQGGTLQCLLKAMVETSQQQATNGLAPDCQHEVLRLAEMQADDFNLDRPLFFACRDDRERFCRDVQAGNGQVFNCLSENMDNRHLSVECRETMLFRLRLMQRDYKLSHALVQNCQQTIQENQCTSRILEDQADHFYLTVILLCLENVMKQPGKTVPPNCQQQMYEHRRLLMSQAQMNPEMIIACSTDIEVHCKQLRGGGETMHCLMGVAKRGETQHTFGLTQKCMQAVTKLLEAVDVGSNYQVDRVLYNDCKQIIEGTCKKEAASEKDVLSCLLRNLDDPEMTDSCEERLLEIQYFLSRDFVLDPQLYQACKNDAETKCGHRNYWAHQAELGKNVQQMGPDPGILVLTCLYRHAYVDDKSDLKLSNECTHEVRRVLRERAISVRLLPHIEKPCMGDLATHCSQRTNPGEEMICLQDNLETLSELCKDQVRNLTILQGIDIRLNAVVTKSCGPVIQTHCKELLGQDVDNGEVTECLLENKGVREMNSKCRAYINHIELISMKDYKFDHKFSVVCKPDIEQHCLTDGKTDKLSIIRCLSEIIVHHTLLNKGPKISSRCKDQMRSEHFRMDTMSLDDWIKADPDFVAFCKADLKRYECDKEETTEDAMECLKERKHELNPPCRKYIFKREKLEFGDSNFDHVLNRACGHEIRRFCSSENKVHVLSCLEEHKGEMEMSVGCLQVVEKRQHEQSNDVRLQPVLFENCLVDMERHCKDAYKALKVQDKEREQEDLSASVITCLRQTMIDGKVLQPICKHEVMRVIYESEVDPSLDPPFYEHCKTDISRLCPDNILQGHAHSALTECMKTQYKDNKISNESCKNEMKRRLQELLLDIHLDEALFSACQKDLDQYCYNVNAGDGKKLKCLFMASHTRSIHLSNVCRDKLEDRQHLWSSLTAANDFKSPEGFGDFAQLINESPAKNYLTTVILIIILAIFIIGLCCGRVTKRVRRELKNR